MPTLAVSFSDWIVHDIEAQQGDRVDYLVRGAHVVTPAKRGTTHYFWGAAFDVPSITEEVATKTRASIKKAFDEDRALLEHMQAAIESDPRGLNYPEVNLSADGAAVRERQHLKRKLQAERGAAA